MSEKFAEEAYVESVDKWLVPATVLFIVVSIVAAFGLQFWKRLLKMAVWQETTFTAAITRLRLRASPMSAFGYRSNMRLALASFFVRRSK